MLPTSDHSLLVPTPQGVREPSAPATPGGDGNSESLTTAQRAEREAAVFSADFEASAEWRARERATDPSPDKPAARTPRLTFEQMAARAMALHDESAGTDAAPPSAAAPPVAAAASSPAASVPGSSGRLSREEWLKRELDAERLRKRTERASAERIAKLKDGVHVFGPRKQESLLRARQTVRARTMEARPAQLRRHLVELQADPVTAYLVIGLKRICDARGWSPVDIAARRVFALLLFLRELAIPHAWNTRYVRPRARRGSRRLAAPEKLGGSHFGTVSKFTPCARAIDQRRVLTEVLALEGHSAEDDRSSSVKTVQRALRTLESVSLIQSVQVPPSAAEPWELGESGYAFNRYYVATPGSPKPALMGVWTADDSFGADVLARPWAGMRPRACDPPPIAA